MSDPTFFADLLSAQQEMPALQKSAINPHFGNKYVPLEELLQTVLPILNKHNFVLIQTPGLDGQPVLEYHLLHVSGERIGNTMALCAAKDDPQGQGSAITYARRYSLMSLLGLTADVDDDAERTRPNPPRAKTAKSPGASKPPPGVAPPPCPKHGDTYIKLVAAGTSKATGKAYQSFYACDWKAPNGDKCAAGVNGKSFYMNHGDWMASQEAQNSTAAKPEYDPDDLPDETNDAYGEQT